jgi:hypothetical protein
MAEDHHQIIRRSAVQAVLLILVYRGRNPEYTDSAVTATNKPVDGTHTALRRSCFPAQTHGYHRSDNDSLFTALSMHEVHSKKCPTFCSLIVEDTEVYYIFIVEQVKQLICDSKSFIILPHTVLSRLLIRFLPRVGNSGRKTQDFAPREPFTDIKYTSVVNI